MKKSALKKTSLSKKIVKNRDIWYLVKQYFIAVFSVFIITLFFSLFQKNSSEPKITYCANSISCIKNLNNDVENNAVGMFDNHKVIPPKITLNTNFKLPDILGVSTSSAQKHIYVNLADQTLSAYDGNRLFMKTFISSGKWHPTPDGDFTIWYKLRTTRMTGGEGADYYDLPNVPYVMFFSNDEVSESDGFSLHGAYWHNNFGHPMSHGCVNMRIADAEKLYSWATPINTGYTTLATTSNPGTEITIYGTAPTD